MNKTFVFVFFVLISCTKNKETENQSISVVSPKVEQHLSPLEEGKILLEKEDCLACHKLHDPLIGPSYKEIAEKYSEEDADLLANKIIEGGVGVWGDVPMTAHPNLGKEEAKKMIHYILSLKK